MASLSTYSSGLDVLPAFAINTFLVSNILMTMLQWYWASLIVTAVVQMVVGDPRHKEA